MKAGMAGRILALILVCGPWALAAPRVRRKGAPRPAVKVGPQPLEGRAHLQPFFQSLRALTPGSAEGDVVRVLHFGDSHTAADRWTGLLRQRLQARFGDAGPGLLLPVRPWRGYHHAGVKETFNLGWPSFSLRSKETDGLVGLTGGAITLAPGEAYGLEAVFRSFRIHTLGPDQPTVTLSAPVTDAPPVPVPPLDLAMTSVTAAGQPLRTFTQAPLPLAGPMHLALTLPASSRLLGVELRSGRSGVTYEELGLNGAELFDLEKWRPQVRAALLEQAAPALLVVSYGTNEMGRGDLDPEAFRARAGALLTQLSLEAHCPILVVGPLDRGARKRGALANLRAGARTVVTALRLAARDAHCAFWNAQAAMGGPGAITRWRKSGWAQKDLAHLTDAGYQRIAQLQCDALLNAYDEASK